ncbi:MAG: non-canonical purine NTP pyrophosphatase [Erysipelotrichaceae bacterium]|nr:non-canonical purine NTP pyrophosphatase [Erysipelotrichaceae bacterium]
MKHKVLLVTSNEHKLSEFQAMMDETIIELVSLKDIGYFEEIIEDQLTYQDQAVKKSCCIDRFISRDDHYCG